SGVVTGNAFRADRGDSCLKLTGEGLKSKSTIKNIPFFSKHPCPKWKYVSSPTKSTRACATLPLKGILPIRSESPYSPPCTSRRNTKNFSRDAKKKPPSSLEPSMQS